MSQATTDFICPAGSTVLASVTSTATSVFVAALQPVNAYHVVNSGAAPVQLRFGPNVASPVTAVFPTTSTPSLGSIVGAGLASTITIPSALNSLIGTPGGLNSNVQISLISNSGTAANVFITPIVI
jgi:hypothetical protein